MRDDVPVLMDAVRVETVEGTFEASSGVTTVLVDAGPGRTGLQREGMPRGFTSWYNGRGRVGQVYKARLIRVRMSRNVGGVGGS